MSRGVEQSDRRGVEREELHTKIVRGDIDIIEQQVSKRLRSELMQQFEDKERER